jgi:hypothetical protein
MVDAQLASDGAATPFLNVIIAQDLRFEIRGDAHNEVLFDHDG